ncbi:MAG: tryptophan synthase subunit alpha [Pseudomonadota bacterium]
MRITEAFQQAANDGRAALIPFLTAGDPNIGATVVLGKALAEAGADIIELGIPFSDPIADGPTIQAASKRALDAGFSLKSLWGCCHELREGPPLVLMTYYNPVYHMGLSTFAAKAAASGVAGVIIPDLPPEEAADWKAAATAEGLDTIFLLAPTSNERRVRVVDRASTGFIYYVSLTGVTGARTELPPELEAALGEIRSAVGKPVAVGFGISRPEQVARLAPLADGIIVGSALVRLLEQGGSLEEQAERLRGHVAALRAACGRA